MKHYEKIEGSNKELKIEVYYSKGGYNYFTGKEETRGYYLSVSPVERVIEGKSIVIESFAAFSGTKKLVKEVQRYSQKTFEDAVILAEEYKQQLIQYVLEKNNLISA